MLNWIEKKMLSRIHKKMSVKITKDNLILSFTDLDGNGYYKFPKGLELPLSRISKVQEFLMWLSKGISKDEYLKALDIAEQAMNNGIKDTKGMAKIGFVLAELKERSNMVVHDELFYNILAAQLIRQDEDVTQFNNDIHLQKVEAFKELDKLNDNFFLNIQEYLESLGLANITKFQYENLMSASVAIRKAMDKMLSSLQEK